MMRTTAITITLPNTFFISTRSNVLTFVKPHNLLFFTISDKGCNKKAISGFLSYLPNMGIKCAKNSFLSYLWSIRLLFLNQQYFLHIIGMSNHNYLKF